MKIILQGGPAGGYEWPSSSSSSLMINIDKPKIPSSQCVELNGLLYSIAHSLSQPHLLSGQKFHRRLLSFILCERRPLQNI